MEKYRLQHKVRGVTHYVYRQKNGRFGVTADISQAFLFSRDMDMDYANTVADRVFRGEVAYQHRKTQNQQERLARILSHIKTVMIV